MARTILPKPLYAGVGVTDLAVEIVRDLVTETQTRIEGLQKDVTARVADVQKTALDAKARREAVETRVAELSAYPGKVQKLVDGNVATATDTYADLVKRGESLVGRIRRQESTHATVSSARTTVAKARTTTTQAKKAAEAETTATKRTATARKTAARKSPAKKAPARKAPTKKTTTAQSSAKATVTAAKKTASNAAQAAEKVGD